MDHGGAQLRISRRLRGAARALLAACAILAVALPAAAQPALETAVKATFLYKFAPFVEWPARAFDGPGDALVICVQGDDAFAGVLEEAIRGQRLSSHPMLVRRLARVGRDSGCHILFAVGSKTQSTAEALHAVAGLPVLTVTDAARGSTRGMVHFVLRDSRVRFMIDDEAASRSGLSLSSKLLNLAIRERGR